MIVKDKRDNEDKDTTNYPENIAGDSDNLKSQKKQAGQEEIIANQVMPIDPATGVKPDEEALLESR